MRPAVLATGALYALMPDESAALTTYVVFGPTTTYVTTQTLPPTHAMPTATLTRTGTTLTRNTTLIPTAVRPASNVTSSETTVSASTPVAKPTAPVSPAPVAPKGQKVCNEVSLHH